MDTPHQLLPKHRSKLHPHNSRLLSNRHSSLAHNRDSRHPPPHNLQAYRSNPTSNPKIQHKHNSSGTQPWYNRRKLRLRHRQSKRKHKWPGTWP